MDIKEIALKVASELDFSGPIAISPLPDHLYIDFAEALIAELAKQNESVASVVPCYTPSGKRVALNTEYQHLPVGTKLYTLPPTAEQIANETAEVIAKMLDDAEVEETHYCMNTYEEGKKFQFDMVEAILNGAWKDFKK